MARKEQFKMTERERRLRTFSDEFKRQKVAEIERNITSISELCREYEVSRSSIYQWFYKYSKMRKRQEKVRVESKSDTSKLQWLREQIRELERTIGQKQLLIDYQAKVIDLAEQEYKVDIKKKFGEKPFTGTGSTGKNTKKK